MSIGSRHMQQPIAAVLVDGCCEDCFWSSGEVLGEEVDSIFQVNGFAEAGKVEEVIYLIGSEAEKGCGGHFVGQVCVVGWR